MQHSDISFLQCPLSQTNFTLSVLKTSNKNLDGENVEVVEDGILFSEDVCFYPVIKGIPRLIPEAIIDHKKFLKLNLPDFEKRSAAMYFKYGEKIHYSAKKNRRTKESFKQEWNLFDYEKDKTWGAEDKELFDRFLLETNETTQSLQNKFIFDAGCGHALLNINLAEKGIENVAMDFSDSIERAYERNRFSKVHFIQGDVQFCPLKKEWFDIVHCSGVLIHTNNTKNSFQHVQQFVKPGGKLTLWLYHPRKSIIHNLILFARRFTSRLPLKLQYPLYKLTVFPISFIIKKLKGNKQNSREMMIDILDGFTPEFRWEHTPAEVGKWYAENHFYAIKVTVKSLFGFSIAGTKNLDR
jgi:SAM-dependent methyltransferase/uncharacterized protein YbaR (Trm112 family)